MRRRRPRPGCILFERRAGRTLTTSSQRGLRITWVGHSTVLLELDGVRLITDPVLRSRMTVLRRVAAPADVPGLGSLDAALVSHLHYDHLDLRSLDILGRELPVFAPAGGARLLRKRGFEVMELAAGDTARLGAVEITATDAVHKGRRAPWARDDAPAVGYVLSGTRRVYFAGDTDLFDGMETLAPDLDVALLPVAGWGARVPAGHLDPPRAAEAARRLHPRIAVPIHWGTYRRFDLGKRGSLRAPAEEFATLAGERAPGVDVRILPVGGSLDVPVNNRDGSPVAATR
ncbi:MAG: MBL fold metallo-hydrolase [Gaiellaceae bacterium]